jgi:uncharacterized protein YndB with AHSA1/START domain
METPSHETLISGADRGCLVICDVSGYSDYLHSVELEHAQDILADLTETIVHHLRPTFRHSKLEGDAAFAYALEAEIEASMLLDTIEDTYFAFKARVRDIDHATSCDCAACRRIPELDLKIITHYGRFTRQRIVGTEELAGPDVILVHRLLKNSARERIGTDGYALHSEACIQALGVDPAGLGLIEHREHYDDVGEVVCYLDNLEERWRYESERRRVFVVAAEAEFEDVVELPAPVAIVWDWITSPEKRPLWEGATERVDETTDGGRRGVGTTNHCVHGRSAIVQRILDWRPFRYFTMENVVPVIGPWSMTFEFEDIDGESTRVRVRAARLQGLKRRAMWAAMRRKFETQGAQDWERLRSILEEQRVPTNA